MSSPLEKLREELQLARLQNQDRAACGTDGETGAEDTSPADATASASTAATNDYIKIRLSDFNERALQLRHDLDMDTAARKALQGKLRMLKAQVKEAAESIEELLKKKSLKSEHATQTLNLQTRIQELVASNAAKDERIESQALKIESMEACSEMQVYISGLKMRIEESAARDVAMQTMTRAHAAKIEVLGAAARKNQFSFGGIKCGYLLDFIFIQTVIEWVCAHWPYYRSIRPTIQWVFLGLFVLLMTPQ